jgi:6-phosphogluconolactonase/glucosamine-6-phosphate isomerase/deaminase
MMRREPYVHVAISRKPLADRLTVTYPLLAAQNVSALVTGAEKARPMRASLRLDGATPFPRVLRSLPQTIIYTDLNEFAPDRSK